MARLPFVPAMLVLIAGLYGAPLQAQGLLDKIKRGAGDAADKVGETVGKGTDAVQESLRSAQDLVTNEATPEETRAELDIMAENVLSRLLAENAAARDAFAQCYGYAVFDTRKVSVFPFSAAYGRGVAVDLETTVRTYMNMGSGGLGGGLGIGGFENRFVIMFESRGDFVEFTKYGFEVTAEAEAMYGEARTGDAARFVDGRRFFALGKKAYRVGGGATGTKFWKSPELN